MEKVVRTADVLTDVSDFNSLMLNKTSLKALARAGFSKPSPVQAQAIPYGMLGFDLLVQAKSGTGKTMVFSLLAVENLNAQFGRPQVLIIAPTREIASQIMSYIRMLAPSVVHVRMFVGGNGRSVAEDIRQLKKSVHIVVGTVGRLCHLVRINALRLPYIRLFILDEADKLMEDSFQKEINYLFSALPREKQVAVFSATYPYRLDSTLIRYMRDVHVVRVDTDAQLLGIKQYVVIARNEAVKMDILLRLLLRLFYSQCEELCADLRQEKFDAVCISGSMSQTDRTKAMRRLKNYTIKLLVSTDLIARGIDAAGVNIVVNYGSPSMLATYLHRIGRAGRFGTQGIAFTIINSDKELKLFSDLVMEGKLQTKLLRAREDWPRDLIYNNEFFSRSENFRPYRARKWHSQKSHNDVLRITFNSVSECEEIRKFSEDKTVLHQKSEKLFYSNQDFYNIYRNMENCEISDNLLEKLVELKIRSPEDLDLVRKNTLITLSMLTINKSSQDLSVLNEKSLCLLNTELDFTMDEHINMSGSRVRNKKRRYLRNQILAIRKTLSDEEWLQYAELRFGSVVRCEPFLIHEGEGKENVHEAKPTGSNKLEPLDSDRLLLENSSKYALYLEYPVRRSHEKYMKKSTLVGSSGLEKLNSEPGETSGGEKNDTVYETSEELRMKLAKVKSAFNHELALRLGKIRECVTATEVPKICSMTTQTEDEEKLTETTNIQTDGLSFDADNSFGDLDDDYDSFHANMGREMSHFTRYMSRLRGFNF